MRHPLRAVPSLRDSRGAAIVLVAVSTFALLGFAALAVDLGMMIKIRAEAQRAADAAALGGASAFQEQEGLDALDTAFARAQRLAQANQLQGGAINLTPCTANGTELLCPEMTVLVLPDSDKVRVWIYRKNIPTLFARILGFFNVEIGAKAAAEATQAGTGSCVKPFLIPDYWAENTGEDLNTNRIWDLPPEAPQGQFKCEKAGVECWGYAPADGDVYYQYGDTLGFASEWTGLGTDWRNAYYANGVRYEDDIGRPIMLYPDSPQVSPTPSNFYLWRIECPGGDCVREAMANCTILEASVGDMIAAEQPGGLQGPVSQGVNDWIAQDPSARWVETTDGDGYQRGQVVSDLPGKSGLANPRVFVAALMRPEYLAAGYDEVPILNLARFFLESGPTNPGSKDPLVARFLGPVSGLGPEDPTLGTLVKVLRLVE
jgi:hypothetical protein